MDDFIKGNGNRIDELKKKIKDWAELPLEDDWGRDTRDSKQFIKKVIEPLSEDPDF